MFFCRRYNKNIFTSYKGYVESMYTSLSPFFRAYPPQKWLFNKTILDLGSGLGRFTAKLSGAGCGNVIGLEYQYSKSRFALQYFNNLHHGNFINGSATSLPFRSSTFDTVFSFAVFEHIKEPYTAVLEVYRVLKEGGIALLAIDYITSRGGHHLHPYIHFPWPLSLIDEVHLCKYWSELLQKDQAKGDMQYYKNGEQITQLSEGGEISLNKISISQFEKHIFQAHFKILRAIPGETLGKLLPFLLQVNILKVILMGSTVYVLEK